MVKRPMSQASRRVFQGRKPTKGMVAGAPGILYHSGSPAGTCPIVLAPDQLSEQVSARKCSCSRKRCVGFVFTKAGKIAATAIGGSLLLFQIAQHQGYVKVNWSRLNKDLQQAQNELARRTDGKLPRLLEEAQKFVKDNVFLATGFAGGFLLGVASS
ncbi:FUN14 domain-containing protein 1-like [Dermacentor variabilis]|uniref:FUN14 domain-containing protein 1-like n=1 Tax=Dermacentor variabilis TaxID=34621 RepID=UPI003F5BB51C